MRVWVTGPVGESIPLEVSPGDSCKTVKKKIGDLSQCREASGAWTIEGWAAPKVLYRGKEIQDDQTVAGAGIGVDTRLDPLYNSSAYSFLDPAFYGADAKPLPLGRSPCGVAKDFGEQWEQGPGQVLHKGWDKVKGVATSGGVGLEVQQDSTDLSFIVEQVADGYAASGAGIKRGDIITMVAGRRCVDARGMGKEEIERVLSLEGRGEGQTGGWGDWLGGRSAHAIVGLDDMRESLRGVPFTAVTVRYKSAAHGGESESVMWRKDVSSLEAGFS